MNSNNISRNCPVCNFNSVSYIKNIKFTLFPKHPMAGGYNVVQCKKCGFIYADTDVKQDDLDTYYKDLSKYEDKNIGTGGGFTQYDKDRLIVTAQFIADNIHDKSARIVDIGCASGGLLKELKNLGFTNLVAIDPSSICVDITRSEVGCEAYQYSVFDIGSEVGKFDLIILSHVLEHILEVELTIEKLNSLLNDKGYVYVECPNAQNYAKVIHAPYQELNTEHINHFNEVSFENLFGIYNYDKIVTGDKTMKIASNDDYHAVYGLFKKNINSKHELVFDNEIFDSISDYIKKSDIIYNKIIAELAKIGEHETIALYGIGQFAFKLISDPVLKNKKNVLLFDSNTLNVGKYINNWEILNSKSIAEEYKKKKFTIVITSLIHQDAIAQSIQNTFSDNNINTEPTIIGFKLFLNEINK